MHSSEAGVCVEGSRLLSCRLRLLTILEVGSLCLKVWGMCGVRLCGSWNQCPLQISCIRYLGYYYCSPIGCEKLENMHAFVTMCVRQTVAFEGFSSSEEIHPSSLDSEDRDKHLLGPETAR